MNPSASPSLHKASLAAIALLLASGAVAAVCCRSLYADGAYRLLIMLTTGDIMRGWPSRLFADYLTDYPVVVAIDSGVRSLHALAILFTISLLYLPLLAYSAAIWIAKDDRMLWTATLLVITACYYPTSFFLAGEFHLLYALFWLGFVIALSGKGDRPAGALALALVAFLTIRSYDLSIVLCPALAGLCVWRAVVTADRRAKLLLNVSVGLLLIAAWTGLQGVLNPVDTASKAEFLAHIEDMLSSQFFREEVCLIALTVSAAFAPRRWLSIAWGAMFIIYLSWKIRHREWFALGFAYDNRGRAFLLLSAIGVILLLLRYAGGPRSAKFVAWPPMVLLFWAAGATIADTADWARYLTALCSELRSNGEVDTAQFLTLPLIRKFNWGWAGPTMSVLLRPVGSTKIILFHAPNEPSFEPFDPASRSPDIAGFKAGSLCPAPDSR